MTETDNPKVKDHIAVPEQNNRSQLLRMLSEMDDDERDFISHFVSREIKPVVVVGEYDPLTKKYVFSSSLHQNNALSTAVSTTSAATTDFVITAGQTWAIYAAGRINATRATTSDACYSIDAGTTLYPLPGTSILYGGGATAMSNGLYFATPYQFTGSSTNVLIRLRDTAFQAGDTIKAIIYYRRVA